MAVVMGNSGCFLLTICLKQVSERMDVGQFAEDSDNRKTFPSDGVFSRGCRVLVFPIFCCYFFFFLGRKELELSPRFTLVTESRHFHEEIWRTS